MLRALWQFRLFIWATIRGEQKARFARSRIGAAWLVLHPLAQALIFTLVLSEVLGARLAHVDNPAAFPVYLMAGLAAWTLFSDILNRCLTVFTDYGALMKKIAFPRIALPVIVIGSALMTHFMLLAVMLVVFLFFGVYPDMSYLGLLVGIVVIVALAAGLGILLGVFNVFTRDISQVMGVLLQMWFWTTPIVYTRDALPEWFRSWIDLNPMSALVNLYQSAILYHQQPNWTTLVYPTTVAAILLVLGLFVFRRASPELVDAL